MTANKQSQNTGDPSTSEAERDSHFYEAAIEDRDHLFASMVQHSDDAIITKTSDGIITSWNMGAERIYGYSARDVLGKPISILIPIGYTDEVPDILERIKLGEYIHHYETVRQSKDGILIHVSMSISPIRNKQGEIIGASTIARDITEQVKARKKAEENLAAASQYARSLIEASLDPLVTISVDGKITDVNEATVKVTGVPREELIGTDFSNYFTEPEDAREGYRQVFAKGFVTDYPLTIRHKDGGLTDVLYNASVYKDASGNVIGVFAAARDVTARKRVEEELAEQRSKELDRIVELEKFQKLTVGRELKMIELKKEIEELKTANERLKRKVFEHDHG
jgi:PAS domain S-box-containing protein